MNRPEPSPDLDRLPDWVATTEDEDAATLAFAFWKQGIPVPDERTFIEAVWRYRSLRASRQSEALARQQAREIEEFSVVLARTRGGVR